MPEPEIPDEGMASILPPADQSAGQTVAPFGDGTAILQPGGGTGHYRVDPERAPQVIAAFRKAAADMEGLQGEARRLGAIPPPGADLVSRNAVAEMGRWAVGPQGSLLMALQQGADGLRTAADNLQAQLDAFLAAEDANTMRPDGSAL